MWKDDLTGQSSHPSFSRNMRSSSILALKKHTIKTWLWPFGKSASNNRKFRTKKWSPGNTVRVVKEISQKRDMKTINLTHNLLSAIFSNPAQKQEKVCNFTCDGFWSSLNSVTSMSPAEPLIYCYRNIPLCLSSWK